ncbi:MAG: FecR domain-containing protein [Burkholderiales bacterium]|nr:FecR domain-containing protein [Burkholderiales bacterium]
MRTLITQLTLLLALTSGAPAAWAASGDAPETITVNSGSITYVTRAGDTLSSIAKRLTTKPENWLVLSKVNNISADTSIPVGSAITIPANILLDDPSEAKVVALSGSITASNRDGSASLLGLGTKITEGMQIETGNNSFLTLSLPDKSRISLPSNSRVKIALLRTARYIHSPRAELVLVRGKVESKVAPLEQNKGRFEVHTPLAVAGVRGTHFRVGINENGTGTEVLSGHVDVGQAGKPGALALHPGLGNIIDGKSVGKPVNLLPAPQLVEAPARVGVAAAQMALTPVNGAQAYHVQIATDQDAQNILTETRATGTRLTLDGLPNGDYYARISAIDKHGLEGPASTHAFTLAAALQSRVNGPAAPYVERSDNRQIYLKWIGASGQKFTVQVARDSNFSWLIYNTKTDVPEARMPRPAFGTYYARVQATNADGRIGPYSAVQSFIVTDQWVMNEVTPAGAKPVSTGSAR